MPGDINVPRARVPWSRHKAVTPETSKGKTINKDTDNEAGAYCRKNQNSWESDTGDVGIKRKAFSESNILHGAKISEIEDEKWDSQSDPGSRESPNKSTDSKRYKPGENVARQNEQINGSKRFKPSVQGRGGHHVSDLRRRKGGLSISGSSSNFVVEMPEQGITAASLINGNCAPRYIHSYLDFMYYSCVSPHKWSRFDDDDQTKCQYALGCIKKVS